jgi:hypothetical protein
MDLVVYDPKYMKVPIKKKKKETGMGSIVVMMNLGKRTRTRDIDRLVSV